jgi:biotin-(acetyl-CoA carboxylase) ligase
VLPAEAPLSLKWPNDVMLGEQKAGGLLIELDGDYFIVGIGINVAHVRACLGHLSPDVHHEPLSSFHTCG